ncbi:uncharacterized protein LOC108118264 isoform X1 [Drosophila eugracilis]|uniref:uncharacterized protein LOC108118264 isoform X1 n=1 Tax=Drosophila eugracilis TaxID=29029 RepID=UPI001BDA5832|nr:uncharacterized protein LOC108118264 isoform X1 [Drosophila eugracilis]XP_041673895.1 uncharacterized protein LOC108118264 isoform X1 [Drosophila eugracilis]XP_041673896.1 uncharacterized protein LOC108118264 isoform X1 [Drosophila eugracilis]
MYFREINKFYWRLHTRNNNNPVDCKATNRYDSSNVLYPEIQLRKIDCWKGTTMCTKQKQAATPTSQPLVPGDDVDEVGKEGECKAVDSAAEILVAQGDDKHIGSTAFREFGQNVAGCGLSAAAFSPIEATACGLSSSRTSVNSTENLSYASDNFYGDDLILMDDGDVDAEDISINSDDCVYAYRGDRGESDMNLEIISVGRSRHSLDLCRRIICVDDDNEFLEMDFEPDPSSELEFPGRPQDMGVLPQANLLLMQRDYSQMSGGTPTQANHLHSSPVEDFPQDHQKQLLSKRFACVNLNLDQIKNGSSRGTMVNTNVNDIMHVGAEKKVEPTGCGHSAKSSQSHSLPNTVFTASNFGRSTSVPREHPEPNLTGTKPKRLSHSSSVMSKSSSAYKSRGSHLSTTFDERCYSCTDFRSSSMLSCQQQQSESRTRQDKLAPILVTTAAVVSIVPQSSYSTHFDLGNNEENCLDCLEKEFLASTIGKVVEPSACPRHAIGRASSLSLYARVDQMRCRSGSQGFFEGSMFAGWLSSSATEIATGPSFGLPYNSKLITCDNDLNGVQLFNQNYRTKPLMAILSTGEMCNEENLVQALNKLHVTYDSELLHDYFKQLNLRPHAYCNFNLKELFIHISKRQGSHRKLKRLIEMVTQQQLKVQFIRKVEAKSELVPIKVADILNAWARYRDLSVLQELDERFHYANVLGKVGHLVRQAAEAATTSTQAASSSSCKHDLPEFLLIPQYYECGDLTLTRKC